MKFNLNRFPDRYFNWRSARRNAMLSPRPWFAWYPVAVTHTDWRWLERVERWREATWDDNKWWGVFAYLAGEWKFCYRAIDKEQNK